MLFVTVVPRILPILLLLYLGTVAGRFGWWDSSIASGSEVLMISLKNEFSKIRTGKKSDFYWRGIIFLSLQSPMSLKSVLEDV